MKRRFFFAAASAAAFSFSALRGAGARLPIKKGVLLGMLPEELDLRDRLQLAREVGFEELECPTTRDQVEAEAIRDAGAAAGLRIHSVMNSGHWEFPLSSADPAVVARGVDSMEVSLRNAKFWGADTVLLVPAVVDAETSYRDAWKRSQREVRKLIRLAKELHVVIAVENVWNKFLLSPLEFARYVDDFSSRWVRAYFDVGNVVLFGYSHDWVRTLGDRIVKLHFKDFRFRRVSGTNERVADFVPLLEGDIDWTRVYAALSEIGFVGTATVEVQGGGREELATISHRVDRILTNQGDL